MKYHTKRGRPKLNQPKKDLGTPELIAKRQAGLTAEPLDLCLKRGILSQDEHWAGIHLRWLYTVIFGVPNVSAFDPASLKGKSLRCDDMEWLSDRELEYARAQAMLQRMKAIPLVPDVCIFSRYPRFLVHIHTTRDIGKALHYSDEYLRFKDGLEALFRVFTGKRKR